METTVARWTVLDHTNFKSALLMGRELNVIHKRSHIEDTTSVRVEQVLWVAGVGHMTGVKAIAPVTNDDNELFIRQLEADLNRFGNIELIPMLDGIDNRLPNGQSNPVNIFCFKSGKLGELVGDRPNHFDKPIMTRDSNFDDRVGLVQNIGVCYFHRCCPSA